MQVSAADPCAFAWTPRIAGSDAEWGVSVLSVDTDASIYDVPVRINGAVVDLKDATVVNPDGAVWLDGRLIWVERVCVYLVELTPAVPTAALAELQGRLDRTVGRTNWGGAHFPNSPVFRGCYDHGYRELGVIR